MERLTAGEKARVRARIKANGGKVRATHSKDGTRQHTKGVRVQSGRILCGKIAAALSGGAGTKA